jgi:pyruvoyl-dependent arginine decarboxylase (PvlArgDC)
MGKLEILPPLRTLPTKTRETSTPTIVPARVQPGGIIDSTLMRWEANRHARTLAAAAGRTRAEADLFDAQSQLVEAYGRRQHAVARLQELPEIITNERAKRRVERAEELRQVQHRHELAEAHRMVEIAQAETALVDAHQALRAQREHGAARPYQGAGEPAAPSSSGLGARSARRV